MAPNEDEVVLVLKEPKSTTHSERVSDPKGIQSERSDLPLGICVNADSGGLSNNRSECKFCDFRLLGRMDGLWTAVHRDAGSKVVYKEGWS